MTLVMDLSDHEKTRHEITGIKVQSYQLLWIHVNVNYVCTYRSLHIYISMCTDLCVYRSLCVQISVCTDLCVYRSLCVQICVYRSLCVQIIDIYVFRGWNDFITSRSHTMIQCGDTMRYYQH